MTPEKPGWDEDDDTIINFAPRARAQQPKPAEASAAPAHDPLGLNPAPGTADWLHAAVYMGEPIPPLLAGAETPPASGMYGAPPSNGAPTPAETDKANGMARPSGGQDPYLASADLPDALSDGTPPPAPRGRGYGAAESPASTRPAEETPRQLAPESAGGPYRPALPGLQPAVPPLPSVPPSSRLPELPSRSRVRPDAGQSAGVPPTQVRSEDAVTGPLPELSLPVNRAPEPGSVAAEPALPGYSPIFARPATAAPAIEHEQRDPASDMPVVPESHADSQTDVSTLWESARAMRDEPKGPTAAAPVEAPAYEAAAPDDPSTLLQTYEHTGPEFGESAPFADGHEAGMAQPTTEAYRGAPPALESREPEAMTEPVHLSTDHGATEAPQELVAQEAGLVWTTAPPALYTPEPVAEAAESSEAPPTETFLGETGRDFAPLPVGTTSSTPGPDQQSDEPMFSSRLDVERAGPSLRSSVDIDPPTVMDVPLAALQALDTSERTEPHYLAEPSAVSSDGGMRVPAEELTPVQVIEQHVAAIEEPLPAASQVMGEFVNVPQPLVPPLPEPADAVPAEAAATPDPSTEPPAQPSVPAPEPERAQPAGIESEMEKTNLHLPIRPADAVSDLAWLAVLKGSEFQIHQIFRLDSLRTELGRALDAPICIDDRTVSTRHAAIRYERIEDRFEFVLYDLASTNGTYVNGTLTHLAVLKDDDRIRVGETDLVFKKVGDPQSIEG